MASTSKKVRYDSQFKAEWLTKPEYTGWLSQVDKCTAHCKLCLKNIACNYEGEAAIKSHMKTKGHKKISEAAATSQVLTHFFDNKEETTSIKAELALTFHSVNHQLSYNSSDCGIKLNCQIFKDSKLANKIHCGRTKIGALTENVLGPYAFKIVQEELKLESGHRYFSVSSDASNKGIYLLYFNY